MLPPIGRVRVRALISMTEEELKELECEEFVVPFSESDLGYAINHFSSLGSDMALVGWDKSWLFPPSLIPWSCLEIIDDKMPY